MHEPLFKSTWRARKFGKFHEYRDRLSAKSIRFVKHSIIVISNHKAIFDVPKSSNRNLPSNLFAIFESDQEDKFYSLFSFEFQLRESKIFVENKFYRYADSNVNQRTRYRSALTTMEIVVFSICFARCAATIYV